MKKTVYLLIVIFAFIASCKKDSDVTEAQPEPIGAVTAAEFLKGFDVIGAEVIRFDSASNIYLVTLPDGYTQEKADVRFSLQANIALEDSSGKLIDTRAVLYDYHGTGPLVLQLRRKTGDRTFRFQVYFGFSGVPQIDLLEKQVQVYSYHTQLALRYGTNVGSIPSGPGKPGALVKISDPKTGQTITTILSNQYGVLGINPNQEMTDNPMNVEITLEGQKSVIFEGVKFLKGKAAIYPNPTYKYQFLYSDSIKVYGNDFVPGRTYSVRFSSDFLEKPVVTTARIADDHALYVDKIPADLPEGSYLLSFYEADKLIGNNSLFVSDHESKAIESIWKGDLYGATGRSIDAISVSRGETFYVKSSPMIYGYYDSPIDAKKLPQLHLTQGENTVTLQPELVIFGWAIAGLTIGVGQYTIPANLPAGNYEVRGLFADMTESKPYWSKLQVK
ncbi:DUF4998 domain-containing protein [Dyadobacter sp. CY326]|uniref:DUF4998 domain-containing protein n=1 Tax=Dyadobacter sp. CY326 TaxID=2907300 RepID=UPI001F462282|nr:DUF4998 domain-containing protein [Dyadobacter sp. CY326]MCE7064871.1 DUF4998 domain-containing protein [Dyadobacter sp. CY326]